MSEFTQKVLDALVETHGRTVFQVARIVFGVTRPSKGQLASVSRCLKSLHRFQKIDWDYNIRTNTDFYKKQAQE